jgi:hypothetical protein
MSIKLIWVSPRLQLHVGQGHAKGGALGQDHGQVAQQGYA